VVMLSYWYSVRCWRIGLLISGFLTPILLLIDCDLIIVGVG
jgi:hypothetical protein